MKYLAKKNKTSTFKKIRTANGQHINQPRDIVDAMNSYFVDIGKQLATNF